jgi:hypothetical protein
MNIYKLWIGGRRYGQKYATVVIASTEDEARQVAAEHTGTEEPAAWARASIKKVGEAIPGEKARELLGAWTDG